LIAELATLLGFMLLRRHIIFNSAVAVILRVAAMTVANYYLLPFFYPMSVSAVVGLLVPIALFNVSQALINIIPACLIYLRIIKVKG